MLFFTALTYVSVYLAMAFAALCLATGLYYVAELAEEYSVLAKKILVYGVFTIITIHIALWLLDRFPFRYVAFGTFSHIVYYQLLKSFPFISLKSISFILSCICFFASHYSWYKFFTDPWTPAFDFYQLLGFFFCCVWLIPGALFITLNIGDMSLPGLTNPNVTSGRVDILAGTKPKQNVVTWVHDFLMSFLSKKGKKSSAHIGGSGESLGFGSSFPSMYTPFIVTHIATY
jgi:hypothetical protein